VRKLQRISPASLLHLFLPQLITAYVINAAGYFFGLGGVRETVQLIGGGTTFFFAFSVPLTVVFAFIPLVVFAAVYNRYNADREGLELELPAENHADGSNSRLARLEPRSIPKAFVPFLVAGLVYLLLVLGSGALIGELTGQGGGMVPGTDGAAAAAGEVPIEAWFNFLLISIVVGTPLMAVIMMGLVMLAALLYNRVSADGGGLRFLVEQEGDELTLRSVMPASIAYLLPSLLALMVITVALQFLLGMTSPDAAVVEGLWTVGVAIPGLYLTILLYNVLSGRRGIRLVLRRIEFRPRNLLR
jgi:hypothetical protein